ncbi:hypothetical protein HMF3257_32835 [Spirosoma telluris]|uniref:Uncharacterized protein n=2 Tax=Spirosoma telluris TaxID=2183553 RepID=A0A327NR14_9BACT|nr:hypothetical protein HMF3257_32835 [Spirosoma telluris]
MINLHGFNFDNHKNDPMKIEIDNSFGRDAKKLPAIIRDELKAIYQALEEIQSLDELTQSKKWKEVES